MLIIEIFMFLVLIIGVGLFVSTASEKTLMNVAGIFAIILLILIPITVYIETYVRTFLFTLLLISNTLTYFKYRERLES